MNDTMIYLILGVIIAYLDIPASILIVMLVAAVMGIIVKMVVSTDRVRAPRSLRVRRTPKNSPGNRSCSNSGKHPEYTGCSFVDHFKWMIWGKGLIGPIIVAECRGCGWRKVVRVRNGDSPESARRLARYSEYNERVPTHP